MALLVFSYGLIGFILLIACAWLVEHNYPVKENNKQIKLKI